MQGCGQCAQQLVQQTPVLVPIAIAAFLALLATVSSKKVGKK